MIRRRAVVSGVVQGVGFRLSLAVQARSCGACGWVRNRPDGSVEAVFEGDAAAVDRLVAWCAHGPRGAEVAGVEVVEEEPQGLAGFRVVP